MPFEHLEEKEAVKMAALIEQNGYTFYTMLADRVEDRAVREVLKGLAGDEQKHLGVIERKFFPEAGFTELITDEELGIEDHIARSGEADIFTKRIDIEALLKVMDTPKKALMLALDTEKYSVRFFDKLSKIAETPEARMLYSELTAEEKHHVTRIEGLLANIS